jgi:DNA-binding phage protein
MVKTKTLKKQKKSSGSTAKQKSAPVKSKVVRMERTINLTNTKGLIPYSPRKELLDERFIAQAVWECLKNNDPEGVLEVIQIHLRAVNKSKAAEQTDLPRSSMYNALKGKNPTVKTLAKLVNCCA